MPSIEPHVVTEISDAQNDRHKQYNAEQNFRETQAKEVAEFESRREGSKGPNDQKRQELLGPASLKQKPKGSQFPIFSIGVGETPAELRHGHHVAAASAPQRRGPPPLPSQRPCRRVRHWRWRHRFPPNAPRMLVLLSSPLPPRALRHMGGRAEEQPVLVAGLLAVLQRL